MPEANLFLMFTQRLNTLGVAYMVSGSVAVIIYGEPRLTHDVDLIVVLDRGRIARLPEVFPPAEFYCPPAEAIAVEVASEQRGHFGESRSGGGIGPFAQFRAASICWTIQVSSSGV